jgi:hypothetical protein
MEIFVSSTFHDLHEYRQRAAQAIRETGHVPILIEDLPTQAKPLKEVILGILEKCDMTITIVGNRSGSLVPDNQIPWTVFETQSTLAHGKPVLIFMVDQSTNLIKQTKTHKALISNLINSHLVQIIKSPSDLLEKIPQAIVSVEKNKKPKSETSVIALPTIKHEDLILFIKYPEELLKCSSRYFEELIAELLKNDGWDVQIVKRNNAPGPDIIAVSTKLIHDTPTKMIVECKRHSINNPVDVNVVRKVMYWVNEEFQATLGMIATPSKFTKVAIERAEKSHAWRLNMKDQSSIIDWLKRQHSN